MTDVQKREDQLLDALSKALKQRDDAYDQIAALMIRLAVFEAPTNVR